MKINLKSRHRVLALSAAGLVSVVLLAWKDEPVYKSGDKTYYTDTLPSGGQVKRETRDLDKELEKLDETLRKLEHLDNNDIEAFNEVIKIQLDNIDFDKIAVETELALKNVDIPAIEEQIHEALKVIDVKAINSDLQKSLKDARLKGDELNDALGQAGKELEIELAKLRPDIEEELADANLQLKKELADIRKLNTKEIQLALRDVSKNMKELKEELRVEIPSIKVDVEEAREQIVHAKEKLQAYQQMIYAMEADNLLDLNTDYKIERIGGDLYINGVKQNETISDRYNKYLGEDIILEKNKGRFKIYNNKRLPD
jgi:bla regulator protein blaR1